MHNFDILDDWNSRLAFQYQENFRSMLLYHLKNADNLYYEHQETIGEQPTIAKELRECIDAHIKRYGEIMLNAGDR